MQRKHIVLLVAVLTVFAVLAAGTVTAFDSGESEETTEEDAQTDDQLIHVSADGEAKTSPDEAVLMVAVTAEDDDIEAVRDDLATGADELTATLDELGVEYETSDYDVSEQHQPRGEETVPEYAGVHAFTVTADDPDRTGEIIDEATGAGAEINDVSLTLSDDQRETIRDEAIRNAMSDARQQADTIAATSGLEVTTPSEIDASQQRFSPIEYRDAAVVEEADDSDDAPPTEIESGDVAVSYTVDVTYNATSD